MRIQSASESMAASWLQIAPEVKSILRPDKMHPGVAASRAMPAPTERAYVEGILRRTREASAKMGLSQAGLAALLRIGKDTYKTYETRSPLPHYLIEQFCGVTHTDVHYFVTGRQRQPSAVQAVQPSPSKHRRA